MRPSTSNLEHQKRNWLDLPSDVTSNILSRIGMIDILKSAQKVCTVWRKICKDPAMWRVINMKELLKSELVFYFFEKLCKHVIDRSQGQLVDITFVYDNNDALFQYVADRSSVLRYLKVTGRYEFQTVRVRGLTESLMKFPLLEELSFYRIIVSKETIETVCRHFPELKTLKVNQRACSLCVGDANEESLTSYNEIAIAIGGSLHELKHLELTGNKMSNIGLQMILDGCRHLETLDLRECFYIDRNGNSVARCLNQINHLKLPTDSLGEYPYVCARHVDYVDEYPYDYVDEPELYGSYMTDTLVNSFTSLKLLVYTLMVQLLAARNFCWPCSRNLLQFNFGNLNSVDAFVLF